MAKKQETKSEQMDSLANDVLSIINKKFKEFPNAAGYLSDANLVTDWVKSGNDILDLAIANRPNAGVLGLGSILSISGLEGSGKSLLAAHILAECQKMGGLAILFDTENAVGMLDFYTAVGLDAEKAVYIDKLRALEDVYQSIEYMIERAIEVNPDRPVVFVVDSVMGATTNKELEADYNKQGYATEKALINSLAMRKIPSLILGRKIGIVLINQLRANPNAGLFQDKYQESGGMSIAFTASVRLRIKKLGVIKVGTVPVGEQIEISVVKNRFGPPRRKVKLDVYYDSGIDNYGSWLSILKDFGFLKQSGSQYSYVYVDGETGEEVTKKFQSKQFKKLLEDSPELKKLIYGQICDAYIMKYKIGEDFGIDDITIDTNIEED